MPKSATDWARVKHETKIDAAIPFDPENEPYDPNDSSAVEEYWAKAMVCGPGRRGPQKAPRRVATAIRLPSEVTTFFKATGPGWQTRIGDVLHEYVKKEISRNSSPL